MVSEIYMLKNKILEETERRIASRGMERIDVKEIGELVDMVKDLAEAEASCWEAEYYRSVSEAMKGESGYNQMGYDQMGYGQNSGGRSGYGNGAGTGSSAGYGMRSGYDNLGYSQMSGHQDPLSMLRKKLQESSPDDRERLRNEVKTMIGAV